jgi:diguanylate cyclase (GGDEF)-like protein
LTAEPAVKPEAFVTFRWPGQAPGFASLKFAVPAVDSRAAPVCGCLGDGELHAVSDRHIETRSMNPTILIVDDNPAMIQLIGHALQGLGQIRFAASGQAALAQLRDSPVDLVLLDAEMPVRSGFDVLEAMKADSTLAEVPVIFVTGHGEPEIEVQGLEAGAVDFIAKPLNPPLLVARVRTQLRLKRLADELRANTTIDGLTSVANRRCLDETLEREWRRMRREQGPLSLLLVDVDHFQRYNDRYGRPAGDGCLRALAQTLRGILLRPADLVARHGGEQFALLLPHTDAAGAQSIANEVLDAVEAMKIPHEASPTSNHVTVSIGACCIEKVNALDATGGLFAAAEAALQAAKRAGRAQAWALGYAQRQSPDLAREIKASDDAALEAVTQ